MQIELYVGGGQSAADGIGNVKMRGGRSGQVIASELDGRFYEDNLRGNLFSGGMTLTSISNATFTSGTLGATCTPVAGIWNPNTSGVIVSVLQAVLNAIITAATCTGGAPFVWATSVGNAVITTGNAPISRSTLATGSSKVKDMSGVALTGLTNNLVVRGAAALGGGSSGNFSFVGTAVGQATMNAPSVDNLDGSIIIPPGGVLALLATTTPVAISAASALMWSEKPVGG